MADRDPVEVAAGALIRYRLVGYDRGMEPSMDGAYVTYADAVALARTEAARAGEAMRFNALEVVRSRLRLFMEARVVDGDQAFTEFTKMLSGIESGIAALPLSDAPASPWRPIAEAPRDGTEILLCAWVLPDAPNGPIADMTVGSWDVEDIGGQGGWVCGIDFDMPLDDEPSHWMPLPTPPR